MVNLIFQALSILLIFGIGYSTLADKRDFVWTYQYLTMHKGGAEVELYHTRNISETASQRKLNLQFELEVGMTDRFDFAIYEVFNQLPESSLAYKETKFRGRYRLGAEGGDLLPILYLEYKTPQDFSYSTWEFKPIVGFQDFGYSTTWAINPILEWNSRKKEVEIKYAGGVGFRINEILTIGAEIFGSRDANYIGPTVAHGREDLWVALGAGWAVGKTKNGEPEAKLRLLLGFSVGRGKESSPHH